MYSADIFSGTAVFLSTDSLQRLFRRGFPRYLLVFIGCACLTACEQQEFTPDFGDPYEIIVNDVPGAPDKPPRVLGDWLMIMVAYSGGCSDHDFNVTSVVRRDTAHIWVQHDNGGDACEAFITDDLSLKLPTGVLATRVIAMHDPAGDPPHLLKW